MNRIAKRRPRRQAGKFTLVLLGAYVLFEAPSAMAAFDLAWRPQLQLGMRATDNLRSAINDPEAAWGFDMGGGVQFEAQSATLRSRITPAFNFRRFAIGEGADADEYEVRTSTQWTFSTRASVSLDFDYIRDSTLSTELTDTGRQTTVANRDTINVAPSIVVLLTDTTTLNLGFYFSDVQFEELEGTPFSDYDFKQINGTLTRAITDRLSVYANAYVSEFRTPSLGGKSLTYGGLGGATYQYSDTLEFDFGVGYVQSEIDFQAREFQLQLAINPVTGRLDLIPVLVTSDQSTVENGPIARASIGKQWSNVTRTEFSYSRSVSPTVFGAQSSTDDILVTARRELTDRFVAIFRGGYNIRSAEAEAIGGQGGNLNRDQVLLAGGLRYRINPQMSIGATYRFIYNDPKNLDEASYKNGLFVNFIYNGEPHTYRGF